MEPTVTEASALLHRFIGAVRAVAVVPTGVYGTTHTGGGLHPGSEGCQPVCTEPPTRVDSSTPVASEGPARTGPV